MAKTPAEYQRAYRARKAEQAKQLGDPTDQIAKRPFNEYLPEDGNWSTAQESLGCVGVEAPTFDADTDDDWDEEWGVPYRASIGRAERMVGAFLDAATELAGIINRYKRREIEARIADLEAADLTDPAVRRQALADIARLTRMSDQLEKQVRWTLPQFTVTGEN